MYNKSIICVEKRYGPTYEFWLYPVALAPRVTHPSFVETLFSADIFPENPFPPLKISTKCTGGWLWGNATDFYLMATHFNFTIVKSVKSRSSPSNTEPKMLKLGDSIKICVSCALSYWSNVWHDLPSGSRGGHSGRTPFTHFSWRGKCHIFYERTNYIFFMNSKILHFFPTIHFVTAWASGTFPLTYTLKDMSVQQVFPFGTEIYSDQSSPIGCYS